MQLADMLRHAAEWQLTQRELEVLDLLATGKSNSQIEAELFIARNTLKTHMSNIYSKINVCDRTQAALWAYMNGFGNGELERKLM